MPYKDEWAFEFQCDKSLEQIGDHFNETGPWVWQLRENYIFGSYLNCRPSAGVHVKLNFFPQAFITGSDREGFAAILRIETDSVVARPEVDEIFAGLLAGIEATDIAGIEPYD